MSLSGLGEAGVDLLAGRLASVQEVAQPLLEAGLAVPGLAPVGEPQRPRLVVVASGIAQEGERLVLGVAVASVRRDHVVTRAHAIEKDLVDVADAAA